MPCNQERSKIDEMSGSQKFSQNFHRKVLSNLLRLSDVHLEMSKINLAFQRTIDLISKLWVESYPHWITRKGIFERR